MSVMAAACDQANGIDQTRLFSCCRHVERDARHGWVTAITIEGKDKHVRALEALGTRLSSVIINRHNVMDSINEHSGHGENQDVWPVQDWAAFRSENAGAARA